MKEIKAYIHHIRSAAVTEALRDANYKNITLLDVKGTLSALCESEQKLSEEAGVIISEVKLELICEDQQFEEVAQIIKKHGQIGKKISGWIYISPVDKVIAIEPELIS